MTPKLEAVEHIIANLGLLSLVVLFDALVGIIISSLAVIAVLLVNILISWKENMDYNFIEMAGISGLDQKYRLP